MLLRNMDIEVVQLFQNRNLLTPKRKTPPSKASSGVRVDVVL